MTLGRILRFLGIRRGYTNDEVLNAENENDIRDHREAVRAAKAAAADRAEANRRLHIVLRESQARSREFEKFERLVRREANRVRRDP